MTQETRILLETTMNEVLNRIIKNYGCYDIFYNSDGYSSYFTAETLDCGPCKFCYDSLEINTVKLYGHKRFEYDFRKFADEDNSLFILDVHLKHYFWKFLEDNYPKGERTVPYDRR